MLFMPAALDGRAQAATKLIANSFSQAAAIFFTPGARALH
jgi:hypothetical protein